VKKAAGFDAPKFLVGSLGRLESWRGTFRYSADAGRSDVRNPVPGHKSCGGGLRMAAARTRWEIEALEYASLDNAACSSDRRGHSIALDALGTEI